MIIGVAGKKNSGKDTVGAYLVNNYGFERRAFADSLKKSVSALFENMPIEELERHKLDDTVYVTIGYKNNPDRTYEDKEGNLWSPGIDFPEEVVPSNMWSPITELTFREFLQRYGTESHRAVFGYDFWVDQTLPVGGYYAGTKLVITDVRFQNEVDRIHELDGRVIYLHRPPYAVSDGHVSEDVELLTLGHNSYNIVNDGTIEDLHRRLDEYLSSVSVIE